MVYQILGFSVSGFNACLPKQGFTVLQTFFFLFQNTKNFIHINSIIYNIISISIIYINSIILSYKNYCLGIRLESLSRNNRINMLILEINVESCYTHYLDICLKKNILV